MTGPSLDARLSEMARTNRALVRRARRTDCHCPAAVLNLGASVVFLAGHESCVLELNRFLDEAVLEDLFAARRGVAEDLDLLESLSEAGPDSPDIEPLAKALLGRIQALLEREGRVLYQPLLRLSTSTGEAR